MASTLTNLVYHIVFSTKHREPIIDPSFRDDLYRYMGGIIRTDRGMLLEIGGMPDHVHLLAKLRPSKAISDIVREIKAGSSGWRNSSAENAQFAGQIGYGAFTVSASQIAKVRNYIRRQEEHHRVTSFQDEFRALLRRHGVEFDGLYVWD
jgi:REP element-mobilizing transposase RayT